MVLLLVTGDADNENECGIVMAHYLYFLSLVNNCVLFGIACTFAKVVKNKSCPSSERKLSLSEKAYYILYPVVVWLSTKFSYHFKLSLMAQSMVNALIPITYFYNWMKPGNDNLCMH